MNKRLKKKKNLSIPNSEIWGLNYTLAKYILPRLKRFKEVCCSYPCELTETEWKEILNKMIWSFQYIIKNDESNELLEIMKENEQCQEGLNLFAKYFRNLWD